MKLKWIVLVAFVVFWVAPNVGAVPLKWKHNPGVYDSSEKMQYVFHSTEIEKWMPPLLWNYVFFAEPVKPEKFYNCGVFNSDGVQRSVIRCAWNRHRGWNNSQTLGKTAPVPEPATMLLMGAGLLGLVAVGRKKKKAV